jgi:hypothetical protein
VLLVSLTGAPEQVQLESILAKALQVHGGDMSFLTSRGYRRALRELRALNVGPLVFSDDYAPGSSGYAAKARRLIGDCTTVRDFKELDYRGARIGRQALSSVVRARYEPRIDLRDPELRESVARSVARGMEAVDMAERLLDATRPDALLMIERGYAGVGAIFDVALARDIPAVQFQSSHRDDAFVLKRYSLANRELHPRSLDESTWQRLLAAGFGPAESAALEAEMAAVEHARWFLAARFRHSAQRRSREELRRYLGLDDRKVAAVFSHVLWDASMFYGRDVFDDQGEWFSETVRLAAADDRVQWLVKLHPALYWKLRDEGVTAEPAELAMIRDAVGELPAHVKLLAPDAPVSNVDLFGLVDACLTIRGTVGIELPPLGVPVLTAGTSDYSGRGFTVDATTREEYAANVRSIAELPRLRPEQQRLAQLYAYGVFCRRPWRFSSFTLEYLAAEETGALGFRIDLNVTRERELRLAPDLESFASWMLDSDEPDYVAPTAA